MIGIAFSIAIGKPLLLPPATCSPSMAAPCGPHLAVVWVDGGVRRRQRVRITNQRLACREAPARHTHRSPRASFLVLSTT